MKIPVNIYAKIRAKIRAKIWIFSLVMALATTTTTRAVAIKPLPYLLSGTMIQGSLIRGRAAPGAAVTLDGKNIAVSPDGRFVFGLGRDHKVRSELVIRFPKGRFMPDGGTFRRLLKIRSRRYSVQHVRGLPPGMVDPKSSIYKRLEKEYLLIKAARDKATAIHHVFERMMWPVRGRISGVFGSQRVLNRKPKRPHFGVDIAALRGTPVRAAASGIVSMAYDQLYLAGRTVLLDHGLGVSTVYIHLHKILVKPGQKVRRGQIIGQVGTTGRSTGPHLHWGLNWFQLPLDPALVVGPMPGARPLARTGRKFRKRPPQPRRHPARRGGAR